MELFKFSESESERMKLKIYRCTRIDGIHREDLLREILAKKPDMVRLRVPLDSNTIFEQIEQTAFPYNIHKSMLRMSVTKERPSYAAYVNPEIVFHPYDVTRESTLRRLLSDSLSESTEIGFTNSIYEALIDHNEMMQTSLEYYVALANEGQAAGNFFYLAYLKEECIGFCSFQISNKASEGIFFTIAPAYRSKGLAIELLEYGKKMSFFNGADVFSTNTIIQNPRSIYPQMKVGLVPQESYMNVLFFPLLSMEPFRQTEIVVSDAADIYVQVYKWLHEIGYSSVQFEQVKTYVKTTVEYPEKLMLKLFILKGKKMVLSACADKNDFRTYFMADVCHTTTK